MSLEERPADDRADSAQYRYAQANERYRVLGECLTMVEAIRRRFSRNEAAQEAKEGYERAFDEESNNLEVLRQMMREERTKIDSSLQEIVQLRRG